MNLMSMLGGNKYVMQAIGAMMRGDNPQEFIWQIWRLTRSLSLLIQDLQFNLSKFVQAKSEKRINTVSWLVC